MYVCETQSLAIILCQRVPIIDNVKLDICYQVRRGKNYTPFSACATYHTSMYNTTMLILKSDRCPFITTTIFMYVSPTYGYEILLSSLASFRYVHNNYRIVGPSNCPVSLPFLASVLAQARTFV